MKIFVAYGYNDRDQWISTTIPPLITAFGSQTVDGSQLPGQVITDGVRDQIRRSDALIAFFTRREGPLPDGTWSTHDWVRDEFNCALENRKLVLEIYEEGVAHLGGMAGDNRQYLTYREDKRLECVIEIVKALGKWHQTATRRFQLVPVEKIKPYLAKPSFRCRYRIMDGNRVEEPREVNVLKLKGGLAIDAPGISQGCLIQIEVTTDMGVISSDYTAVDAVEIQLTD